MKIALVLGLILASAACRQQVLADGCGEEPCTPCETDADCVIFGNPCLDTAVCAHVGAGVPTIAIGCDAALEYAPPPAEACACIDNACGPR